MSAELGWKRSQMTMPHLMNCEHIEDGWCLDCVGEQYKELKTLRARTIDYMPLHSTGLAMPMFMLNEEQAQRNHGQSLKRLAERGGLSPSEALANMEKRRWDSRYTDLNKAMQALVNITNRNNHE